MKGILQGALMGAVIVVGTLIVLPPFFWLFSHGMDLWVDYWASYWMRH